MYENIDKKETIKEEIKIRTELIRIMALVMLADITGLLSLFLTYNSRPVETVLIVFGIFTNFVLALIFTFQVQNIFVKIRNLNIYDNT